MKQCKNRLRKIMTGVAVVALAVSCLRMPVQAEEPDAGVKGPAVEITAPDNKVLTYEPQKAQDFVLNVKNTGDADLTNLVIGPDLKGESSSKWPFKTDYQKYSAIIKCLSAGSTEQIKFSFTQRDNVDSGRYLLHFTYAADGGIMGSSDFYVNTTKKVEEKPSDTQGNTQNAGTSSGASMSGSGADDALAGGVSNGGAFYSGGGSGAGGASGDGSVPRVIVTGFSTDPAEVKAGSNFTLTIHLKNTSKKSRVGNMLFDLNAPTEGADEQTTAPAFLPTSGSSTVYLESIKANGTADIKMQLNAKADLLQKPYSVELSMKYEDSNYNQIEAASSLSIPVKQDARFEFSEFQINPETITVGEECNVMCNLYNLGRIKLYNVKTVFEGKGIERSESFVGNVESGASASIDAMLKGTAETSGSSEITMTMSYENESGEIFTEEKKLKIEVLPEEADMTEDVMMDEDAASGGIPLPLLLVILLAAVAAVVAVVIIRKKKKQKKSINEEEELLYELDGTSEDERQ